MATKKVQLKDLIEGDDYKAKVEGLSFEEGLQLLEELVGSVEGGGLVLERSIASYERGVELLAHLRGVLAKAEEKLRVLGSTQL